MEYRNKLKILKKQFSFDQYSFRSIIFIELCFLLYFNNKLYRISEESLCKTSNLLQRIRFYLRMRVY